MAKLFMYVFITIGLMVLFNAAGLNTTTGFVIKQIGFNSPEGLVNFQSSDFYIAFIVALVALASVVAVIIGVFGKSVFTIPLSAGIASTVLIMFIGDLISIVNFASAESGWVGYLLFLIMAPFVGGYILAIYNWVIYGTG